MISPHLVLGRSSAHIPTPAAALTSGIQGVDWKDPESTHWIGDTLLIPNIGLAIIGSHRLQLVPSSRRRLSVYSLSHLKINKYQPRLHVVMQLDRVYPLNGVRILLHRVRLCDTKLRHPQYMVLKGYHGSKVIIGQSLFSRSNDTATTQSHCQTYQNLIINRFRPFHQSQPT
jgi:hypothetical protein